MPPFIVLTIFGIVTKLFPKFTVSVLNWNACHQRWIGFSRERALHLSSFIFISFISFYSITCIFSIENILISKEAVEAGETSRLYSLGSLMSVKPWKTSPISLSNLSVWCFHFSTAVNLHHFHICISNRDFLHKYEKKEAAQQWK